jgi:hypothetical protein
VAILVAVGMAGGLALLATAALREAPTALGHAEFEANRNTCVIRSGLNAVRCQIVARNVYEITFSRDLTGSIALATRGSCCPGEIAASRSGRRQVIVTLADQATYPVRAQVLVP